ncbi:hypothetical protein C453_18270 [Haloferax elongans ATCC BAA-1513]|uniref:ATP-grasp domain-containing protein n=1 Tax=Haloferax elongans ATCC BAA-1513 TaxID=1230453 RepID=M0HCV8_HALEO|nr:sugar-transfer associated ATP-grasp domain-containing protein [Haloferax elongans]ELZ80909.1 hypothetical protein C453_18270 [Haloferax elongans ATCC BAA-1513]
MTDSRLAAALDDVLERFLVVYPIVGLILALFLAGALVQRQVPNLAAAFEPYRLFFQIAIAGLAVAFFRNTIGARSYGLFAPASIAFVLVLAGPSWGVLVFLNVFIISLATAFVVSPLRLGSAPRLATQLVVIGFSLALFRVLSALPELNPYFSATSVFFPTIITVWFADRFARDVDERGWPIPSLRLAWTLGAIFLAYLVMSSEALVSYLMTTPTAWSVLVGVNILVGYYSRFRLTEYVRFGDHFGGALAGLIARGTTLKDRVLGDERPVEYHGVDEVLSMNERNRYIARYNPPAVAGQVEKATIKQRLHRLGIPAPETYAVAARVSDLQALSEEMDARDEFVLKPGDASGGEGIVVVSGRNDDGTFDTSMGALSQSDLSAHAHRIVQGQYTGLELRDSAILEERIVPAPFFETLCGGGVPDVRVIVFRGIPVMSMTRLPTRESDGAANLHKGAVGVGLSIADGRSIHAFQQSRNRALDAHPDTGADISDVTIPNWNAVLVTAAEAATVSNLGYCGVDITLDESGEPVVFEVNVRPGLGIQNATQSGLKGRLRALEQLPSSYDFLDVRRAVALARTWDRAGWPADLESVVTVDEVAGVAREAEVNVDA